MLTVPTLNIKGSKLYLRNRDFILSKKIKPQNTQYFEKIYEYLL